MNAKEFDWRSGEVVFWDLAFLDPSTPLLQQVEDLKEDLAQVHYASGLILDIGWYPEFSEQGCFVVRVVLADDWDSPLFLEEHKSVTGLVECISRAIMFTVKAPGSEKVEVGE